MNDKSPLFTIGIVAAVVVALGFFIFVYPWIYLWFGIVTLPKPPKPTIRYGEFPFQLTYELNGETKIIEDVAICEFDGYSELSGAGQSRKWKTYLKSEMDDLNPAKKSDQATSTVRITLLDLRECEVVDDDGYKVLELYFYGGNGHYYMGDELGSHGRPPQDFKEVYYIYQYTDSAIRYGGLKADKALEKYNIRLIDCQSSPPFTNSFETRFQRLFTK